MTVEIVVNGQPQLLEIVLALGATGGLASLLDSRQKQGHEDSNDGDHHQELDEGESRSAAGNGGHGRQATGRWDS
jgi:hypothetical protein